MTRGGQARDALPPDVRAQHADPLRPDNHPLDDLCQCFAVPGKSIPSNPASRALPEVTRW